MVGVFVGEQSADFSYVGIADAKQKVKATLVAIETDWIVWRLARGMFKAMAG